MPNVVYATKAHPPSPTAPKGVLVYMRTAQGNDALAWMNEAGRPVTQSQLTILKAAVCTADTEALPRTEHHHALTGAGLAHIIEEEKSFGGALGRPSGARFKAYERLKRYRESLGDKRDLFITDEHIRRIDRALEEIYRYPLYQSATDTLNRQLKAGIDDHRLADLVHTLREDGRLCVIDEQENQREPKLICSMGYLITTEQNMTIDPARFQKLLRLTALFNELGWDAGTRSQNHRSTGELHPATPREKRGVACRARPP